MEVKNFNSWLNESEGDDKIVNQEFAEKLISDIPFLKRLSGNSAVLGIYKDYKNGQQLQKNHYILRLSLHKNLHKQVEKLLNEMEFDTVPDLISGSINIKIRIDESLPKGDFKISELYDWKDRHTLSVSANPENYSQLKNTLEKSIEHLFEEFKKVRIIIPSNIKRIEGLAGKIKDNVKSLYDSMIDEFYENGDLPENLINDDILTEIFTKTLLENPQYIEQVNKLHTSAKKRIFSSGLDVFKGGEIEINQKNLGLIKALFTAKKTWSMI